MSDQLIHGDCLNTLSLLESDSVDLVCTDPPYGDNCGYGRAGRTIAGNEHPLLGLSALAASYRLLKRNRACFFFLDAKHLAFVDFFVRRYTKFSIKEYLVWDKRTMGMGFGYRKRHEMILALEKGRASYNSAALANVLPFKRVSTPDHPHTKPVELLQALILHATRENDVVLDPFLGSGTTAIAAKATNRRYIGIERESGYVQLAKARLSRLA
jgi:DNA modification methylase